MTRASATLNLVRLATAGAIASSHSLATAQDVPRVEVNISAGLEASTNPLLTQNAKEAGAAYISIDPTVFLEDGRHRTAVDGNLRLTQYTNNYGTDASVRLRVGSERALSERISLSLRAAVQSSRTSFRDGLAGAANDPLGFDPGAIPEAVLLDPTLVGTRGRTTTLSAIGSLEYQISPLAAISGGASFSKVGYAVGVGFDNLSAAAFAAYRRRVSPQTGISLEGQVETYRYEGRDIGDARVYSVATNVDHSFSTQWSLIAGVGVNVVDQNLGASGRDSTALLAVNAGLCKSGLDSRFCLTAQRSAQPTALGGASNVTSIGASYELRLSKDDVLSVNSQFGRTGQRLNGGFDPIGRKVSVMGTSANFRHDLSDRSTFFVGASYADVSDAVREVAADFSVRAGITINFGRTK